MKRKAILALTLIAVLAIVIGLSGCNIEINSNDNDNDCAVKVRNNSSRSYSGLVWADGEKLFDGRINAWESRTFYVRENCRVYTFFESDCGRFSSPSGKAKTHKTLVLEL